MFAGVLFFFWGISTMLSGGGAGSVEERMARYAGGKADVKATAEGKRPARQRNVVDPFATLSSDVQDKRFTTRVQRDLARANLKLRVAEYYSIRIRSEEHTSELQSLLDLV